MDLEDVRAYTLNDEERLRLLAEQDECTFCWVSSAGAPAAVTMAYLWEKDSMWLASIRGRKRVTAVLRHPTVSIAISGLGTSLGSGKSLTYQGPCQVLDDPSTKEWYFLTLADRVLGDNHEAKPGFITTMDSPNRVILRVEPERLLNSYDGAKLRAAMRSGA
jgi:nitroimidazol reductase NimA-like FMN-containing flavoprotein (pyridoxamine 5'-phosphate oxidase superfamily)